MGQSIYKDLEWLPRAPADFSRQVRGLKDQTGQLGLAVKQLASFALDDNQLIGLAKAIEALKANGESFTPLQPFRLGVLGNGTLDYLVPALVASAARHGFLLNCIKCDYGQIVQEAVSPSSAINQVKPDAVLIALDYRGLPLRIEPGEQAASEANVSRSLALIETLRKGVREHGGATTIVPTFAAPAETLFGSFDRALPCTLRHDLAHINETLAGMIAGSGDILFDVAGLAEAAGAADWFDPALWNLAKVPFSSAFLPLYADHVARLIAAFRGKSRKGLVLDLDNTLWGGVIGDDGLEGIKLAQGDAAGEAHLALQSYALSLRGRGVVLAVSSKNDDAIARRV